MKFKEPVSGFTHFFAAILALIGTIFALIKSIPTQSTLGVISIITFGVSLMLLYSASTIYHLLIVDKNIEIILRKIDHMMIFVLIAGTYTPICIISLNDSIGKILLIAIWSFAILGILLKLFWMKAPRFLSTSIYVLMGWLVILAIVPLYHSINLNGLILLILGGLSYTLGAIIYAFKWPNITNKYFGFHEIFHVFVMFGSLFHFLTIYYYVL